MKCTRAKRRATIRLASIALPKGIGAQFASEQSDGESRAKAISDRSSR